MKKKFLALISMLIAIVMCFALMACNVEDGPDKDPDEGNEPGPTVTADDLTVGKLNAAINKLSDDKTGYKATFEFNASLNNSVNGKQESKGSFSFEKRGMQIKAFGGDGEDAYESVLNFETGYEYNKEGDHYTVEQGIPAGVLKYMNNAFGDVAKGDDDKLIKNEKGVVYNKDSKTLTVSMDAKDDINSALDPIIDAYKKNSSVTKLINDYIALYDDSLDLDTLLGTGIDLLDGIKDQTVGDVLTAADASLEDILKQAGVEIDSEMSEILKAVNARKIGDAIMGAILYVDNNMEDVMAGEFDPEALINAVLVDKVDNSALKERLAAYKGLLMQALDSAKVKTLVDMLAVEQEDGSSLLDNPAIGAVYTIVTEEIRVAKAEAQITIEFDDNFAVKKLSGKGDFAHTYSGSGMLLAAFADNDYHVDYTLAVTDYTEDYTPWTFTFAEDDVLDDITTIMVMADGSEDLKIYFETKGNDIELSETITVMVMYVDASGRPVAKVFPYDLTSYDAEKHVFTVKKELFDQAKKLNGFDGTITLSVLGKGDYAKMRVRAEISGVTDDPEAYLQSMIAEMIEGIIGGMNPPDGNIPEIVD